MIEERLPGREIPALRLTATTGETVDLADARSARLVLYVYPRTGVPGEPTPKGWDEIPGARGCTPQNCGFRDHARELSQLGAIVYGVSAQPLEEQREFAERNAIPYPLLNDSDLRLAGALGLPTFEAEGMRLYRRLALVGEKGLIAKVFHHISDPERNARDVVQWLRRYDGRLGLLRTAYAAFNRRDLGPALDTLHPAVEWPNLIEGGVLHGRAEVGGYWRAQFDSIDPQVTPERAFERDDELVLQVHQQVRDARTGAELGAEDMTHVYGFRDGLISRMVPGEARRGP